MNSNNVLPTNQISIEENSTAIYTNPCVSINMTNMSTFKITNSHPLPSKPSDVKKRSNNRKQIYAAFNSNNNNNTISIPIENENCSTIVNNFSCLSVGGSAPPPPPPPPLPVDFEITTKVEHQTKSKCESIKSTTDFQSQIEQAKTRLKKVNLETSSHKIVVKSYPQCKLT